MKYIKLFESSRKTLFNGEDFIIEYNENDHFCYTGTKKHRQYSAIFAMADLIREENNIINDPELRGIKLREKDKAFDLSCLKMNDDKWENIQIHRSSDICYFIGDELNGRGMWAKSSKEEGMPLEVYMELTAEYYPIIGEIIKKSDTLGDVIDNFKVIYNKMMSEMDLKISAYKYNL